MHSMSGRLKNISSGLLPKRPRGRPKKIRDGVSAEVQSVRTATLLARAHVENSAGSISNDEEEKVRNEKGHLRFRFMQSQACRNRSMQFHPLHSHLLAITSQLFTCKRRSPLGHGDNCRCMPMNSRQSLRSSLNFGSIRVPSGFEMTTIWSCTGFLSSITLNINQLHRNDLEHYHFLGPSILIDAILPAMHI